MGEIKLMNSCLLPAVPDRAAEKGLFLVTGSESHPEREEVIPGAATLPAHSSPPLSGTEKDTG